MGIFSGVDPMDSHEIPFLWHHCPYRCARSRCTWRKERKMGRPPGGGNDRFHDSCNKENAALKVSLFVSRDQQQRVSISSLIVTHNTSLSSARFVVSKHSAICSFNPKPVPFRSDRQAFDHDGNGTLDVSDLDDLLRMLRGVYAGLTSGGVEGAMEAMDKDHSGQVKGEMK